LRNKANEIIMNRDDPLLVIGKLKLFFPVMHCTRYFVTSFS
jgi:hypothetical protein